MWPPLRSQELGRRFFERQRQMLKSRIIIALIATAVAGCDKPIPPAQQARPVRTVTVEGQIDAAQAQLRTAQEQLSYTVLHADGPGVVTAKGAEPGEVVQAGKMIVQVARQGPRDAVFDVPEQLNRTGPRDPLVQIA